MVEETSVGPSDPRPRGTLLAESTAGIRTGVQAVVRPLSARARLAVSLGVLASVLLGIAVVLLLPSATLNVVCRHDFRSVELTIAVDGDVVLTETLSGSVKKWLGVVERTGGTYTRAIPVASGKHTIQVRMRAPGYDSARVIRGDFDRGKQYTLSVDSARDLSLSWRSAGSEAVTAEGGGGGSWLGYGRSLLLTVFGSIVSATIGVYVQAFLHSRKHPLVGSMAGERDRPQGP